MSMLWLSRYRSFSQQQLNSSKQIETKEITKTNENTCLILKKVLFVYNNSCITLTEKYEEKKNL